MVQFFRMLIQRTRLKIKGRWRFYRFLKKHGGSYSKNNIAAYLSITEGEVIALLLSHQVLAYRQFGRWYFSVWQFNDNKIVPRFNLILNELQEFSPSAKIRFFLLQNINTGMRNIDELRENYDFNMLLEKAKAYYHHGA